jgi:hypothetical protein
VQKNRGGTQGKSQYLLECTKKTTMAVNINCRKKKIACLCLPEKMGNLRVEGRIFSVHRFPIFSGKQRHAIFFFLQFMFTAIVVFLVHFQSWRRILHVLCACIFKCSYVDFSFYVFQGKWKSCKGRKLCLKCHR